MKGPTQFWALNTQIGLETRAKSPTATVLWDPTATPTAPFLQDKQALGITGCWAEQGCCQLTAVHSEGKTHALRGEKSL